MGGGDPSTDAKRQWLHQALGVTFAKADGSGDPSAGDSDVDDAGASAPSRAAPSAGRRVGNDTDLMDPNEPDGGDSALPAPMQKDCVPDLGKVAGPKEHVLCKKHGHVLDLKAKTIIAHTIAEYNAQHPVPRPMESDCKPQRGLIPKAPDNIVMCATHGHVLDLAKKQIIANSGIFYLRAHPEYVVQPKPKADTKPATPQPKAGEKPATPQTPPAQPASDKDQKPKIAKWFTLVKQWRYLRVVVMHAEVSGRTLSYEVSWYCESEDGKWPVPPGIAHAELTFEGIQQERKGPSQVVAQGSKYSFTGTLELEEKFVSNWIPTILVHCRVIVEGGGADTLEETGMLELRPDSTPTPPWKKK